MQAFTGWENAHWPLVESKVVYERLQELDISERTVRTAAQEMEIKSTKQANTWYMSLPDEALEEQ